MVMMSLKSFLCILCELKTTAENLSQAPLRNAIGLEMDTVNPIVVNLFVFLSPHFLFDPGWY